MSWRWTSGSFLIGKECRAIFRELRGDWWSNSGGN
jgi:hypothetical protein